jgi:hypothetical protein
MSGAAVEVVRFDRAESRGGYLCALCLGYGGREHVAASHWAWLALDGGAVAVPVVPICEQHARDLAALTEALAERRRSL